MIATALAADSLLTEALALSKAAHLPGVRARRRDLLERTIELAESALAEGSAGLSQDTAITTLVRAHTARAEDARYGAGQLARGSQRAPTEEDCEDGWLRVESIVEVSEASAQAASRMAALRADPRLERFVRAAQEAARAARAIVTERNRAYTFHADPRFSFGEGWYLAAAAVLTGVTIQIEPGQAQTEQAELFLREAGLGPKLTPYRARPRANKALPDLVARAFRADAVTAQARVRAAFLGQQPIPTAILEWAGQRLAAAGGQRKSLVWVRYGTHHASRNSNHEELLALCQLLLEQDITPVLVGDALRGGAPPDGAVDLTLFWKEPLFQSSDMRRAQLQLFECLRLYHGLLGQVGVTTAGMDGPALLGLPTMYLTQEPNVRLGRWVGAVPGYQEIVRTADYLERIAATLVQWRAASSAGGAQSRHDGGR